jgi:xyloglucan fucosyltransferase
MMERCFFVDFPFFNTYFEHELDFSWERHKARLLAHGHDVTEEGNAPETVPFGYVMLADTWLLKDIVERYEGTYGVRLWKDLDYSAAMLQANPFHQVRAPAGQAPG